MQPAPGYVVIPGPSPVAENPHSSAAEIAMSAFGAPAAGAGNAITTVPGELVAAKWVTDFRAVGFVANYSTDFSGLVAERCYIGARFTSSDARMTDCTFDDCRDVPLWIDRDCGHTKAIGLHLYGGRLAACYAEGCAWHESTNCTYADAPVGLYMRGWHNTINGLWQHNPCVDIDVAGYAFNLHDCTVLAQADVEEFTNYSIPGAGFSFRGKTGVRLGADRSTFTGGYCQLSSWHHDHHTPTGNPVPMFDVSGNGCTIDTYLDDDSKIDGSTGLVSTCSRLNFRLNTAGVTGFHGPLAKIYRMKKPCFVTGVVEVEDFKKSWTDYFELTPRWAGRIDVFNRKTGVPKTLYGPGLR